MVCKGRSNEGSDVGGGGGEKVLHVPGQSLGQGKVTDSSLPRMGASDRGDKTTEGGQESRKQEGDHEKGKETRLSEQPNGIIANLDEENREGL